VNAINFADWLQIDPNSKQLWHFALFGFALLVLYKMVTDGDFAAKVLAICVILFGLWFLAGCTADGPTNPLGVTDRTKLQTDASIAIAQADRDARIAAANARVAESQADESAAIAASNASIITEQTIQNGETARAHTWAGLLPVALLIIGATIVLGLIVNWQGRIWYERTQHAPALAMQQAPMLDANKLRLLQEHARQRGMWVVERDGEYLLTDGVKTIKALPKG
jgi:hypothetical protein